MFYIRVIMAIWLQCGTPKWYSPPSKCQIPLLQLLGKDQLTISTLIYPKYPPPPPAKKVFLIAAAH